MKYLYRNIKGVANISSRLALKRLIKSNKPNLVLIAEPWKNFSHFPKNWFTWLDLKKFANNMPELPLNMWYMCKAHLDPKVIFCDDQHVTFSVKSQNKTFGFTTI